MYNDALYGAPDPEPMSTSADTSIDAIIQRFQAATVSGTLYDDMSKPDPLDEDLIETLKRSFSVVSSNTLPKKELGTPKTLRKCHSSAYLRESERAARDARARKLQDVGLRSLSKARAKEWRELAFRMVFNNITPCPDHTWLNSLSDITYWYV
jgi:hypothetical protein